MNTKTAIIYARVSDRKQVETDISIPGQIEKGHIKAESLSANVLRVFVDGGVSAWKSSREEFEEAISYCEINEIDYFICWSSSRFVRNRFDAAVYKRRLDNCGTKLEYITFSIDRDTDAGRLLDGFLEIMDEHKSIQTSRDTSRSLIMNAKSGYWNGGKPPFGFIVKQAPDNPKRKKLFVNDSEVDTVKKMFDLRLRGDGVRTIALWLNENNMKNRGKDWTKSTVSNLLHNRAVIGKTCFGKTSRRTGKKLPVDKWIIVDSHDPVIPLEKFNKVQKMMNDDNVNTNTSSPHSRFLFTGMLVCGECGAAMHTESAKGRPGRYWYYNCSAAKLKKTHPARRISAPALDNFLVETVCSNIFTRETLLEILTELYDVAAQWQHDHSERRKEVINAISGTQRKLHNLYETMETMGKETPNLSDLTERLREHKKTIKSLEKKLAVLDNEEPPKVNITDDDIDDLSEFLVSIIKKSKNPKRIRSFFSTFINRIEINEDTVNLVYEPQKLVNRPERAVPSKRIWLPDLDSNQGQTD